MAKRVPFFWVDDVFLYGMVVKAVGGVKLSMFHRKMFAMEKHRRRFPSCVETLGGRCPYMVALSNTKHFHRYLDLIKHGPKDVT